MALTKTEANEQFYNAVGGRIEFATEGQGYLHPYAVAKLIAAHAREDGRREIKLLELGANDCAFAISVLKLLAAFVAQGEAELDRVDYFAVEYARGSLEAFFAEQQQSPDFQNITAGAAGGPLVGSLTRLGVPQFSVHLVHSDAASFVSGGVGGFDFAILNELLDDVSCRAFIAGADGRKRELVAHAHEEDKHWRIAVTAEETSEPGLDDMPASTITVRSPESVAIVRGAASLLRSGGMLLVHDYGFFERYAPISNYMREVEPLDDFISVEFGDDEVPRTFYRLFSSEEANVVQITNDISFAELTEELAPTGTLIGIPHGNALLASRGPEMDDVRPGDDVFLSEFVLLAPDGLPALLTRLGDEQEGIRERFASEFLAGATNVFADLLFVKH